MDIERLATTAIIERKSSTNSFNFSVDISDLKNYDVANILINKEPISIINRLQAIKRQRPLSNDEIASLVILRNKKNQNKLIKCAIAILLEETENAKKLLDELPKDERKLITDYPLYSFFKPE